MKRSTVISCVAALLLLVMGIWAWQQFGPQPEKADGGFTILQEWFPYSGYAGEVEAKEIAAKDGIRITIEPGSEAVDPIKLVLAGSADFGVVSADQLIAARSKGAPLVAIGVINNVSPTCFLVRKDSGIKGPLDFKGKKVGVLTGTNTERIYKLMMKKANVAESDVDEIQIPFDLQTYILGQYDVRPAFIYDEPVSLQMKDIEYEIIKPSDFGVSFIGTVYFTRQEVIDKDPKRVQQLVDYLVMGWQGAVKDPDHAIGLLVKEYSDLDKERELRSLKLGIPYFEGPNSSALSGTNENWNQTIKGLEDLDEIPKNSVTAGDVFNDSFVRKAHETH